jgi:hypothetical protein
MGQEMNTGVWYGDFYSPNDGYPMAAETNSRRRMYYMKDNWSQVLRVEISKDVLNNMLNPKPFGEAKL